MKTLPISDHSVLERFNAKINKVNNDCWLWTSAVGSRGYGVFWIGGKRSVYAHRFALAAAQQQQLSDGFYVCHTCDNPLCVNPAHLFLGTAQDNSDDCVKKKRNAFGERNGAAKLDALTVAEIRRLRRCGVKRKAVAKMFGVSESAVKKIMAGDTWKEV